METRNPDYLSEDPLRLLAEHRLGFVYLDGYYMPSIGKVLDTFHAAPADCSIIPLHGGDRSAIKKETGATWDRIVAPKPESIPAAARIVRMNTAREIRTFINVNNHFEGSTPLTIERLLDELAKE